MRATWRQLSINCEAVGGSWLERKVKTQLHNLHLRFAMIDPKLKTTPRHNIAQAI